MGKTDKWGTTEGGALPGADGPVQVDVTGTSFNYDAGYNKGETLVFILEGDCDHEHWQGSIIYSIGNGWETDDNVIVTGRDQFVGSTNFARFFNAVMSTDAADVIKARDKAGSGEGPADASIFDGLSFMFERTSYKSVFNGEETERFLLLPVEFLGEVKAKGKGKGKTKDSGPTKAEIKALRAKIVKLASKSDDHDEFVEAVLDKFPEVEDMEGLYNEVLDEDEIFAGA